MPERTDRCDGGQEFHRWVEVGERRRCRECGLVDFTWSLSRRQMIEALRRAGAPDGDHR
jgi:hypothetical protein